RERKPFPDHLRLRRGPGESLRRQIDRIDNRLLQRAVFAFLAPLAASGALAWITTHLYDRTQIVALVAVLITLLGVLWWIGRSLSRLLDAWRNRYLGYFGERVVAEALEPLKAHAHHVFHDVPAGDRGRRFNLDHVVVGPGGVFAVETKTRRQGLGPTRVGVASHEIIYDGKNLSYPWGEDRHGLETARERAEWLGRWLQRELEMEIPVHPILTFPGWTVVTREPGPITVVSPARLTEVVLQPREDPLGPARIDAIAQLLDARCRDVEF
ncbi:MAG TPA: nuclease-related domain-containing protein, partial [Candidatus Synoicihabitans sp.]|nr:nuclease-related domain-containing protein [Candidatus Synoicihabitans sp.]